MRLLDDTQRRDWLRLIRSENVGPTTFRRLVNRYGGAAAAIEALPELARRGGKQTIKVCSIAEAEREIAHVDRLGGSHVAAGENGYPPWLRHIEDAPPILCMMGELSLFERPCIAMVGSRNASAAGRKFTRQMSRELVEAGHVVVSGLARGIDTAAHEAALEGGTAAVIANGIDIVYPPENADLQRQIARQGALISEHPPAARPKAEHFPRRNRIISGISVGVVVVEATVRSGTLITARLAGEQGREVFAVPGSPLDPRAAGANRLIRQGATLVTGAGDVIEALAGIDPRAEPPGEGFLQDEPEYASDGSADSGAIHAQVIALLSPTPVFIDDIIAELKMPAAQVVAALLELEVAGRVTRMPGQRVALA